MKRRDFIKAGGLSAASVLLHPGIVWANGSDYSGKLVVTVQAQGGWDVTSFCDPKQNVLINNWAKKNSTKKIGNIFYAPFSENDSFFSQHYQKMLVVNGVDAQTNSHTVGEIHTWSGRTSNGFPTITALHSAVNAPQLPISYINNGGYSGTGSLVRFTRLNNLDQIDKVINPNIPVWSPDQMYSDSNLLQLVKDKREIRREMLGSALNRTSRDIRNQSSYFDAISASDLLSEKASVFKNEPFIEGSVTEGNFHFDVNRQAQLAMLAFKAGISISADLFVPGFDTHSNHDTDHAIGLKYLAQGINKLWYWAEQYGVDNRLLVVIGSDFSRTPRYNANKGKDHWPISSYVIMEKGKAWTNRVVGKTDEFHNAIRFSGSNIYPKDVMQELRSYLSLSNTPENYNFQLGSKNPLGLFT